MNEMSRVTVELPTNRLSELYRKLAELCQPENDASLPLGSWEWKDFEIAKKVYEAMSPDAQAIYDMLFETDQGFTVEELAERAGKKASQIRGGLSWPATYAKNYNKVPIHSQTPDGKVFVPADVAEIFRNALGRNTSPSEQSTTPKPWEALDVQTLLKELNNEHKLLIANLRGYDKGLMKNGKSKGLTCSSLAEILTWSVDKVNNMMSSIAEVAAQMGKGAVILRNGEILRLSEDFHKAYDESAAGHGRKGSDASR